MRTDLDDHVGFRQIDGDVADLGQEDRVHDGIKAELRQNRLPFRFLRRAVNRRSFQRLGVPQQREDVVAEDDDLVAALFVILHQKLAPLELDRVQHVQQLPSPGKPRRRAALLLRRPRRHQSPADATARVVGLGVVGLVVVVVAGLVVVVSRLPLLLRRRLFFFGRRRRGRGEEVGGDEAAAGAQIFAVEGGGHFAPDLDTLNVRQVPRLREVHPVRFIEFGADEEVEVGN
mmetsp:Transcript_16402/g.49581  ORF Transcript_16402/g.49581 Transcript_16402/m.49581 type:complete len:231 (+) Transcript_16402:641-1333(+)